MSNKNCRKCKYFDVSIKEESVILNCPHKYQEARYFDEINQEPPGTTPAEPVSFSWFQREGFFDGYPDKCEYYEDTGSINDKYFIDGIDWTMMFDPDKPPTYQERELARGAFLREEIRLLQEREK